MRILLVPFLLVIYGCATVNPAEVAGDWRLDTDDGSWVRMFFYEDGSGKKTTWHAENGCGLDNDFYWEVRGAKVAITEIMIFDELDAIEILDEARLSTDQDGSARLILENYEHPFVRE